MCANDDINFNLIKCKFASTILKISESSTSVNICVCDATLILSSLQTCGSKKPDSTNYIAFATQGVSTYEFT